MRPCPADVSLFGCAGWRMSSASSTDSPRQLVERELVGEWFIVE